MKKLVDGKTEAQRNAERIRLAVELHLKKCEDMWEDTVWALSQELGISEDEIYRIQEGL